LLLRLLQKGVHIHIKEGKGKGSNQHQMVNIWLMSQFLGIVMDKLPLIIFSTTNLNKLYREYWTTEFRIDQTLSHCVSFESAIRENMR
jgi:hypothetical protein